jgi:YHS domain-containing protein
MIRIIGVILFSAIAISYAGDCCEDNKRAQKKTAVNQSSGGCPYMKGDTMLSSHVLPSKKDSIPKQPEKGYSVQKTCPVMGGAINKNIYADYKGKRVYFCCGGCPTPFKKNPEKHMKKLEEMNEQAESLK